MSFIMLIGLAYLACEGLQYVYEVLTEHKKDQSN